MFYRATLIILAIFICLLPVPGRAVTVSSVSELVAAVAAANAGGEKEISIAAGTYTLDGAYLRVTASGVTIAGATGRRSDVVLDGNYRTTEIFQLLGSNITVRDLTLRRARYHPIHVTPLSADVTGTLIQNVHIIDPGQQAVKINQNAERTFSVNAGRVTQSRIELTATGRSKVWEINGSCYTGGVDAHHAGGWRVDENVIEGFWCSGGLAEHGVHFWSFSEDTIVESNRVINCDRGIGFGLGSSGHLGGIIRNNFIFHDGGSTHGDVGVGLESASDAQVYNNTIFHQHSYPNAIEYRFQTTVAGIYNNLTNRAIVARNGGIGTLAANITNARQDWFVNAQTGDLHLVRPVSGVVDRGVAVSGLHQDIDKEPRPMGRGIDIGADEWSLSTAAMALTWLQLLLSP